MTAYDPVPKPARTRPAEPADRPALNVSMPPTSTPLLVAAGVCLLVPLVALMWVTSYAKETPRLGGIPFFFWYQFAWVFLTSALTYAAHRLVLAARHRSSEPFAGHHEHAGHDGRPLNEPVGDGDRLNPTQGYGS